MPIYFVMAQRSMKDRAEAIERMLIKPWEIIAEARPESSRRAIFGE